MQLELRCHHVNKDWKTITVTAMSTATVHIKACNNTRLQIDQRRRRKKVHRDNLSILLSQFLHILITMQMVERLGMQNPSVQKTAPSILLFASSNVHEVRRVLTSND